MSGDAMQRLQGILDAGNQPTVEVLVDALEQVVGECDFMKNTLHDMAEILSRLAAAHIKQDALDVKAILDDFVKDHVQVVRKQSEAVH